MTNEEIYELFEKVKDEGKVRPALTYEVLNHRNKTNQKNPFLSNDEGILLKCNTSEHEIRIEYRSDYRENIDFHVFNILGHQMDHKSVKHQYTLTQMSFNTQRYSDNIYFVIAVQGGRISSQKVAINR